MPAEDPVSVGRGNGVQIEISRPMPLRPSKLGGIGNGSNPSTTAVPSRPPSTSVALNLVGQYHGVTLSPLTENADSSFDSFDSAESNDTNTRPAPPVSSGGSNKPIGGSIVAARANFFSNGVAPTSAPAPTSVPVRPAPAVPVSPSVSQTRNSVVDSTSFPKPSSPPTLGHTEILISKTVVPVSGKESMTKIPDANIKPALPQKGRPLSTPNYNVKAIFNRSEPPQSQPVLAAVSAQSNNTSTLQKMASLFKTNNNTNQIPVNVPEPTSEPPTGPPVGGSTLPRNQSIKATKINRESLRGLEISNPILQNEIELRSKVVPIRPAPALPQGSAPSSPTPEIPPKAAAPITSPTSKMGISSTLPRPPKTSKVHFADESGKEDKVDGVVKLAPIVERSESMRLRGVTNRPSIPQFGSMRAKRPLSMPFTRPTSPPPNPPDVTSASSPIAENDYPYDDCSTINTSEEDAIYASIEDLPREKGLIKRDEAGSTTTSNSDGLLSEIVCELKKKNLDDVYSVTLKKNATVTAAPEAQASSTPPIISTPKIAVATPPSKSNLTKTIPTTASNQLVPKTTTSSSTVATSSAQTYKPYSSSMALRGRYLGATTVTSTSESIPTSNGNTTKPSTTSSATSTTASLHSVPVMSTNISQSKALVSASKPTVFTPTETSVRSNGSVVNPIPLPQQPPVGKLPLTSTQTNNVKVSQIISSANPVGTKSATTVNEIGNSKRPLSPDAEVNSVKPTGHQVAAKSKSPMPKTTGPALANKNTGVLAKSNITGSAPKVLKSSTAGLASRSSATTTPNSISTVSSNKPTTSPSSTTSTSSPGVANTASSGKMNSSSLSSHVHSMQQKFDTSTSSKGPINSGTGNKGLSALPAKSKSNPKR